jgi:hypothetical protein
MRTTGFIGAFAALFAGVLSAASPDPCAGVTQGSASLAGHFTLAARNTTGPQVNATGAPLVLGYGGAIDGAEFYVLAVRPCTPSLRRVS